ncbi:hypothetical protein BDZ89DRAFT_1260587 [Hymenopellis radicata]|nr:hypothetical protein BDZ89DRAFT_1260587 [Hymenopellis radicata]
MSHILFECAIPGQAEIWNLARHVWRRRNEWWQPTLGLVLGAPLIRIKSSSRKPLPGSTRLLRIVLSESAHLIWSLRCERVIVYQNSHEKWLERIDERIRLDCLMTSEARFGSSALSEHTVTTTWSVHCGMRELCLPNG